MIHQPDVLRKHEDCRLDRASRDETKNVGVWEDLKVSYDKQWKTIKHNIQNIPVSLFTRTRRNERKILLCIKRSIRINQITQTTLSISRLNKRSNSDINP